MSVIFQPAQASDIEILAQFVKEFHSLDDYPYDPIVTRTVLNDIISNENLGRVWLICDDKTPVGYIVLTFGYSLEYRGRDAIIDELYLQSTHRNKGYGKAAINVVATACQELGIQAVHLEVEAHNHVAHKLYTNSGFKDYKRTFMTKWLE